jgi:hypothetical protein
MDFFDKKVALRSAGGRGIFPPFYVGKRLDLYVLYTLLLDNFSISVIIILVML